MASLTATLLSGADPRPVQIILSGAAAGQAYEVRGTTADGSSWPVSGGVGVSVGAQVVLTDTRSALNAVVTYRAVVAGVSVEAAPVTIYSDHYAVVQTIDGRMVVGVEVVSDTEPRSHAVRATMFEIAGRSDPAVRLDVPGSTAYTWEFETQGADSATMLAILELGVPIVRRMESGLRDFKPVVLGIVTAWSDVLTTEGLGTLRTWSLTVREIPDPQPSTAVAAFDWDDFDTAMDDRVWSYYADFESTTGWTTVNGALSNPTTGGYYTDRFARVTASAAAAAIVLAENAYRTPAAAGEVWTITARVKGAPGRTVQCRIGWSGGSTQLGTPITLTANWQQITVTATAPAGTTGLAVGIVQAATGTLVGDALDVDAVTVSAGAVVPVGTFDEMFATWEAFDTADWSLY